MPLSTSNHWFSIPMNRLLFLVIFTSLLYSPQLSVSSLFISPGASTSGEKFLVCVLLAKTSVLWAEPWEGGVRGDRRKGTAALPSQELAEPTETWVFVLGLWCLISPLLHVRQEGKRGLESEKCCYTLCNGGIRTWWSLFPGEQVFVWVSGYFTVTPFPFLPARTTRRSL